MIPWLIFAAVVGPAGFVLVRWWLWAERRADARYDAERAVREAANRARVAADANPLDAIERDRWLLLTTQLNDLEP